MKHLIHIMVGAMILIANISIATTVSASSTNLYNITFAEGDLKGATLNAPATNQNAATLAVEKITDAVVDDWVLKITSPNKTDNSTVLLPLTTPISTTNTTYCISTTFMQSGLSNTKDLLYLSNSDGTRTKPNGLVQMYRESATVWQNIFVNGLNGANPIPTIAHSITDEAGKYTATKANNWYKLDAYFTLTNTVGGESLDVVITDLATNTVVVAQTNVSRANTLYPMPTLNKIGFRTAGWGATESLYIKNIQIDRLDTTAPFSLVSGLRHKQEFTSPVNNLALDFSSAILPLSISEISVTGVNIPHYTTTIDGTDPKKVNIVFDTPLPPNNTYTLWLGKLRNLDARPINQAKYVFHTFDTLKSKYYFDFSDGTTQGFSKLSGNGTVTTVDMAQENIGSAGKALKITVPAASDITNAGITLPTTLPGNTTYSLEAKIRQTGLLNTKRLFHLVSEAGRSKPYGLVQLFRQGSPAFSSIITNGLATTPAYPSDALKPIVTADHYLIPNDRWYKINIIYTLSDTPANEKINNVTVTDLSTNNIVISQDNVSLNNTAYPLQNISKINFIMQGWGTSESLYIQYIDIKKVNLIDFSDLSVVAENHKFNFNATINNASGNTSTGKLIYAFYSKDTSELINLINSNVVNVNLAKGINQIPATVNINTGVLTDNLKIKAFFWDGTDNIRPIDYTYIAR